MILNHDSDAIKRLEALYENGSHARQILFLLWLRSLDANNPSETEITLQADDFRKLAVYASNWMRYTDQVKAAATTIDSED